MMNIHHIGYAVPCIEDALEKLTALGFIQKSQAYDDEKRNVRILFMSNKAYKIELVAPLDTAKPSPVDGILSKRMAGPYHICYEVDSLKDSVEKFRTEGGIVIESTSWAGALKSDVIFIFEKNLGIIELVEKT